MVILFMAVGVILLVCSYLYPISQALEVVRFDSCDEIGDWQVFGASTATESVHTLSVNTADKTEGAGSLQVTFSSDHYYLVLYNTKRTFDFSSRSKLTFDVKTSGTARTVQVMAVGSYTNFSTYEDLSQYMTSSADSLITLNQWQNFSQIFAPSEELPLEEEPVFLAFAVKAPTGGGNISTLQIDNIQVHANAYSSISSNNIGGNTIMRPLKSDPDELAQHIRNASVAFVFAGVILSLIFKKGL